jgi:hypothetical protein
MGKTKCDRCGKKLIPGHDGACKDCHAGLCYECWIEAKRSCPICALRSEVADE